MTRARPNPFNTETIQKAMQQMMLATIFFVFPVQAFAARTIKPEKLERIVESIESKMNSARTEFVKDLDSLKFKLSNNRLPIAKDMNPQAKRALLETIDSELKEFRRTNLLPDHPALIELSLSFARRTARITLSAEKARLQVIEESNSGNSELPTPFLQRLEQRLDSVLRGVAIWNKGDVWHGKRVYSSGDAQGLELRIHSVAGNTFNGVLIQKYQNGTSDQMNVSGQRLGSNFSMNTTGMKLGAARFLKFNGVVIGKQIFADISGVAASGKPAGGFAGLRN